MVKYQINLKFKDESKSLNEMITKVLKLELQKKFNMTCNYLNKELSLESTHCSKYGRDNN